MSEYRLIYADPPWQFDVRDRESGLGRAPDQHYPTMTLDQMKPLWKDMRAHKDALLAMWVYDPMLPHAMQLADAWGFKFTTVLFRWFKTTEHPGQLALFPIEPESPMMGLGYHTRGGGCEECWLFKSGKGLPPLRHDIQKEFFARRREHSRKPDEVAQWLVDLYGDVPRLEMFARTRRAGWDVWGNDVDRFKGVA